MTLDLHVYIAIIFVFYYRSRRWRKEFPSAVYSECLSVQGWPRQLRTRRR